MIRRKRKQFKLGKEFKSCTFRFFISDSQLFRKTGIGHLDYMIKPETPDKRGFQARKMTFKF